MNWQYAIGYVVGLTIGVTFAGGIRAMIRVIGLRLAGIRQLPERGSEG